MATGDENMDKMEEEATLSANVDSTAVESEQAEPNASSEGATCSSGVAEPNYSTDVLNYVTSKFSPGAYQALQTSWPVLTPAEQSPFRDIKCQVRICKFTKAIPIQ